MILNSIGRSQSSRGPNPELDNPHCGLDGAKLGQRLKPVAGAGIGENKGCGFGLSWQGVPLR